MNELQFDDLALIRLPVSIGSLKYVLREASGEVACEYRNAQLACTQIGENGKAVSIQGIADVELLLVSRCIFRLDGDREVPVSISEVATWPSRVVKILYEKAREISEMDVMSEEDLGKQREQLDQRIARMRTSKNAPEATTDGSV